MHSGSQSLHLNLLCSLSSDSLIVSFTSWILWSAWTLDICPLPAVHAANRPSHFVLGLSALLTNQGLDVRSSPPQSGLAKP